MQFQAEKEKSWKGQSWKDCSYCTVSNPAPLQGACTTVPLRAEVMLPAAPLPCARVVPWLWAVTKWACWQKTASIIGTQDVSCIEQSSFSEAEEQNCSNSRLTLPTSDDILVAQSSYPPKLFSGWVPWECALLQCDDNRGLIAPFPCPWTSHTRYFGDYSHSFSCFSLAGFLFLKYEWHEIWEPISRSQFSLTQSFCCSHFTHCLAARHFWRVATTCHMTNDPVNTP